MRRFWKGINGYFIHIMISFLLLVLLPISCMGVAWHARARKLEGQYKIEQEKESMHAASLEFGRRIAAVEMDLATFQYSKAFRKYAAESAASIYDIKGDIKSLVQKNEGLASIYLYDTAKNTIYNSASGSYPISEFYDTQWRDQIENSIQFKRLPVRPSLNQPVLDKVRGTGLERIYPCQWYLSILAQKTFGVYLMANIDIKKLGEYVQRIYPIDLKRGETAYVASEKGKIYYSNGYHALEANLSSFPKEWGKQTVWRDGDRIFFAQKFAEKDLYYVESYVNRAFFKSQSSQGAYIAGIGILLSVFLIALAYILSRRLYQPIKGLYAEIKKTSVFTDEGMHEGLDALQRAFEEMSLHYESSVAEEKSYQEFMKMSDLRMMLKGIVSSKRFFEKNSERYLKAGTKGHQLLICRLTRTEGILLDDFENFSFRLKTVINSYFKAVSIGVFAETEDDEFAAFYSVSDEGAAEYFPRFLMEAMNQMAGCGSYIATSPVIGMEEDVREWYRRCLQKITNAMFFESDRDEIMWAERTEEDDENMDSIVNSEGILIRTMVNGDRPALNEEIERLADELKTLQKAEAARNRCCHIMMTLDKEFKFYKRLDVDVLRNCQSQTTLRGLLAYMKDLLGRAMDQMEQNGSMENQYCRKAKAYLEENYSRDINVTEVADAMGISYAYLSKIFKTQPEGNGKLSEYLNVIRINKSKEYLKDTAMSQNEIAEKVGYNNVQSFQRFFKKYENMTPGEYRKYVAAIRE